MPKVTELVSGRFGVQKQVLCFQSHGSNYEVEHHYLQAICILAGILMLETMMLRVKLSNLLDVIERTSNESHETKRTGFKFQP